MRQKHPRRLTASLAVTRLEDRALPASSITVTVGANGSGSLDAFLSDGTPGIITTADGGSNPGTLSTGSLAAVSSARDISVSSSNAITFNELGGTLTLQPGAGRSVTFNSLNGSVRFTNQANSLATKGASLNLLAGSDVIG